MIRIYNTLTNKKEDFVPVNDNKVKMYVCGPTTYNYFHIGNGRAFLFFDVVRRYLNHQGYEVLYVQNLTDIDDKIINKAREDKTSIDKISSKYIQAFKEDTNALGIEEASVHPKATEYVDKMIAFIKSLENKGYAYNIDGDVYFSVKKIKEYGKLSGKNIEELMAGARVEENIRKQFVGDFTLWKKSKPGEPFWASPWGKGRPGWHTECVVMAKDILDKDKKNNSDHNADVFDIHAGGVDLIFPHHENEMAQAQADMRCNLANYWMHNGFINFEGEKMSKSLGNFFTVREILKKYDAEAIRHFYLSKHYRSSIDFNERIMKDSEQAVRKLWQPIRDYFNDKGSVPNGENTIKEYELSFCRFMNDDFNTARALTVLFDLVKEINTTKDPKEEFINTLYWLGNVLGFFQNAAVELKQAGKDNYSEELIKLLVSYRAKFKKDKNWAYADMIRDDLANMGVILQDTNEGTRWYIAK